MLTKEVYPKYKDNSVNIKTVKIMTDMLSDYDFYSSRQYNTKNPITYEDLLFCTKIIDRNTALSNKEVASFVSKV